MKALILGISFILSHGLVFAQSSSPIIPFRDLDVSLILPDQWQKKLKVTIVPANPLYTQEEQKRAEKNPQYALRADYKNMPEHLSLGFGALSIFQKGADFEPEITFHSANEYSRIFGLGARVKKRAMVYERIWNLSSGTEDSTAKLQVQDGLPFVPVVHSQNFCDAIKVIKFKNGRGLRCVVQFGQDAQLLTQGKLNYFFQGLSNDQKTYVLATFPITLDGLAISGSDVSHLGYSYKGDHLAAR